MTRRFFATAILSLGSAACFFDLVDVEPADEISALLNLRVSAEGWSEDIFSVEGSFHPGSTPNGGERSILDPSLGILDLVFFPDTVFAGQQIELQWRDTLFLPAPQPPVITLRLPVLAHATSPGPLDLALRRKAPAGIPEPPWTRGTDLELSLTPFALPTTSPQWVRWMLEVRAWDIDGSLIPVFTLGAPTEVPDTIRVPGGWFPNEPLERLEATLEYDRRFDMISSDGSYWASVWFTQRFRWEFGVVGQ